MDQMIPAWVEGRLQPVEKLEVHRRGLPHPAVSVFVVNGERTLLQRRAATKYHTPGLWANACCTHPRWGEAPDDCAARRLREELGITGLTLERRQSVAYRAAVGGGMVEDERVELFVAEADIEMPFSPDPAEVKATRWITVPSLRAEIAAHPASFTPWLRIYLADHSERLFGQVA